MTRAAQFALDLGRIAQHSPDAYPWAGGLVIDNFAGGGGASTGLVWGLGRSPDHAINHDREALAMHRANHPETQHHCESVWDVSPREIAAGRPVLLVWGSPDCFPAGTLILTREGYRPIERIAPGDEVLTHMGRWRRVTETMGTRRRLLRVRGHGHPGLEVSGEHPFYARRRGRRWNNAERRYDYTLAPAEWMPAKDLERGVYWATPTTFPTCDVPHVPVYHQRETSISESLMWLVGRYLADGWTRLTGTRAELVITCGMHEVDGLRDRLAVWPRSGPRAASDEMAWHERATATAYQFTTSHRGLVEWLRAHFGHGAADKLIPGWALGMDEPLRRSLLAGYVSGDGWSGEIAGRSVVEVNTVSKALAFGVKALAASLGKTVAIYLAANRSRIGEREVKARAIWHLRWREAVDEAHRQTAREDGLEWAPVRSQESLGDELAYVFNLRVEDDESYVADGVVVHNCTHFSQAKGGKPVRKAIRGLAWVLKKWAGQTNNAVLMMENVPEFTSWGPLVAARDKATGRVVKLDGTVAAPGERVPLSEQALRPCPRRKGQTFRAFVRALEGLGYEVQWRELVASDFGAPTSRRRFFLIARRDGLPIVWPEPTHGDPASLPVQAGYREPWRTAGEIIDWSIPCPSIFERRRPLADATLRRIARGIQRYVVEAGDEAFLVPVKSWGGGGNDPRSIAEPMRTVTTSKRGEHALVVPTLVQTGYGERPGQAPRVPGLERPLGTVVATGQKHGLVAAFLARNYGGMVGSELGRPIHTITATDHHSLVTAHIQRDFGGSVGHAADEPLGAITAGGGGKAALVAGHLVRLKGTCGDGQPADEPIGSIQAQGTHFAAVQAFLVKYYGSGAAASVAEPLDTVTSKARFGLVTIHGEQYAITDIGFRMLQPRELFRGQGFPDDYEIETVEGRRLSKTAQIRMCGNSVPPHLAEALVRANIPAYALDREAS